MGDIKNMMWMLRKNFFCLSSLTHEENTKSQQGKSHFLLTVSFWGYVFQIMFQDDFIHNTQCIISYYLPVCYTHMIIGAMMLTYFVYWIVIAPFLTIVGYEMGSFIRAFSVDSSCLCCNFVLSSDKCT
uniref:Uncharacterized protein n=1 Tax=Lactuca sativa TaxID=4236 RepID=A0A9R1W1D1_LACSA|nr:hypothetical protein LSAT_V11C300110940 [Lactuca sativa]